MSVQTQIDRISGNVSAALTAIADKGVTVPSGSTSDLLAQLIASIEAGGSSKFAFGTFVPASTVSLKDNYYEITHNSGFIPDVFGVSHSGSYSKYGLKHSISFPEAFLDNSGIDRNSYRSLVVYYNQYEIMVPYCSVGTISNKPFTTKVAYIYSRNESYLSQGEEYTWFALGGLQ